LSRVVELVGAPGTGKSTVAAEIATISGVVVLKDHRPADLPALAWSAMTAGRPLLSRPPDGVSRRRWMAWLGRVGASPRCVRRRLANGAHAVVLDQGPVYTLGRMAGPADLDPVVTRWRRTRLAECRRLLDVVVLLDGATELLSERIRTRAKAHPAGDLSLAVTRAFVDRERAASRHVVELVATAGGVVVRLDAARPLAENVAAVRALVSADAPVRPERDGEPA
jgi:AAA domain